MRFQKERTVSLVEDGILLTSEKKIAEKQRKYFDKLLNCEERTEKSSFNIENINTQECPNPTLEEIKAQVQKLKNHKYPGVNCVQPELSIKKAIQWIWQVIARKWTSEKLPDDWKVAVVCSMHKKSNKQNCNNYCGISLLNVAYQVFLNCV